MERAGIVDPVSNEGADGVEGLPECHDVASDLGRRHLTNVDRTGGCLVSVSLMARHKGKEMGEN